MTLVTSTLSSIIPPSILVVIAGSIANVSIGTLLVAGLIPGLFIAFVFMVFNHFYAVRYGYNPPTPFNLRLVVTTGLRAILPMLTPVILLGGIVNGFFTPTKPPPSRCSIRCFCQSSFIAQFLQQRYGISWSRRPGPLGRSFHCRDREARCLGVRVRRPASPGRQFPAGSISTGPTMALFLIFLFLIVVGMFMDAIAAMFILIPVLLPPALKMGIDPMHFLIVTVITLTLGLVMLLVGVLSVRCGSSGENADQDVIRDLMIPVGILTAAILALVLFPVLTLGPIRLLGLD